MVIDIKPRVFKLDGRGAVQSAASWHLSHFTKASFLKGSMYCPSALYPHVYVILFNPKEFHKLPVCSKQCIAASERKENSVSLKLTRY